jgi:Ca-activated chloride channel family protein
MMLIPLLLLIILVLTNKQNMEKYFSKEILEKLAAGKKGLDKNTRNGLLFAVLVLFIIALARPVMDKKDINVNQKLIPIVIALDLSKSMQATDIYPNRVSLAKKKLKDIITLSPNATVGILLFAKDSFILSPVTEDFVSLNYIVTNLDTSVQLSNGSNISSVLQATNHMLNDYKVKNLVILSDGGNDDSYEEELEFAKDNNIAVYSIGLATKQGSPIPEKEGYLTDKNGKIVNVKLNESIKNLSIKSGGGYIDFSLDDSDAKAIVQRINTQSKKEELKARQVKVYKELFYYPLGLAVFVLLIALSSFPSFKRKAANGLVIAAALSFYPISGYSFEFEFENIKKAKNYYENKEYDKAGDEYRKIPQTPQSLYNLGNTLYKQGKYKEALKTYSKIVTEDERLEYKKLHNLGNSFVKTNELLKAKEFYEKALKIKNDEQTRQNLDLVNKELEKQKKQNKKDKNKENNKNKNNKKNKDENKEKNQEKKDKKENKENNKKDQKNSKNSEGKNSEQKKKQSQKKQVPISDMEEKKWMKMLQDQNTPLFIQKVESKKGKNDDEHPW